MKAERNILNDSNDIVRIAEDNDNENYDNYRDKDLRIVSVAYDMSEHQGYDESMDGMALYDLEVAETGEEVPFSLYEYEIEEKYGVGGAVLSGVVGAYLGYQLGKNDTTTNKGKKASKNVERDFTKYKTPNSVTKKLLKGHSRYDEQEYLYLKEKGYKNKEIYQIFERDKAVESTEFAKGGEIGKYPYYVHLENFGIVGGFNSEKDAKAYIKQQVELIYEGMPNERKKERANARKEYDIISREQAKKDKGYRVDNIDEEVGSSYKDYAKGGSTYGGGKKYYWITMDKDLIDEYIGYASRMNNMYDGEIYTQAPNKVAFETDDDRFNFTSMLENEDLDYEYLYDGEPRMNIFDKISQKNYAKGGMVKNNIVKHLENNQDDKIYWDAWFRGADGKELEDADKGIKYKCELSSEEIADKLMSDTQAYQEWIDKYSRQYAKGGRLKSFLGKAKEVGGKAYAKGKEKARELAHKTKEKAKETIHNAKVKTTGQVLYETRKWDYDATSEEKKILEQASNIVDEKYVFVPTPYEPKKEMGGEIENYEHKRIEDFKDFDISLEKTRQIAKEVEDNFNNNLDEETWLEKGGKFSVNQDTMEEGSFDLDIITKEGYLDMGYGGSYHVAKNGDVVNVARSDYPIAYNYIVKRTYAKGGKLWIDSGKQNVQTRGTKGTFRAKADRQGLSSGQLADKILKNPSKYSKGERKSAQFVENIGVKEDGGVLGEKDRDYLESMLYMSKGESKKQGYSISQLQKMLDEQNGDYQDERKMKSEMQDYWDSQNFAKGGSTYAEGGEIKSGDFVKKKGSNLELKVVEVGNDWRSGKDFIKIYNDVTNQTKTLVDWSDYELVSTYAKGGEIQVYGTKDEVKEMYRDYLNNFLSVEKFAEYYEISEEKANRIIEIGREHANKDGYYAKGGEIIVKTKNKIARKKGFDDWSESEIKEWGESVGWNYNKEGEKYGGQALKNDEFFIKSYAKGGEVIYSDILNEVLDERGYDSEEDINKDTMSRREAEEIRNEAWERYKFIAIDKQKARFNELQNREERDEYFAKGGEITFEEKNVVDSMYKGYADALLFSELDDDDEPLEYKYYRDNIDDETTKRTKEKLLIYYRENKDAIIKSDLDLDTIGNNIWYTRGGHGAGFFDHNLDSDIEEKLTKGANKMGEYPSVETYDGKISVSEGRVFDDYAKGGEIGKKYRYKSKILDYKGIFPRLDVTRYIDGDRWSEKEFKVRLKDPSDLSKTKIKNLVKNNKWIGSIAVEKRNEFGSQGSDYYDFEIVDDKLSPYYTGRDYLKSTKMKSLLRKEVAKISEKIESVDREGIEDESRLYGEKFATKHKKTIKKDLNKIIKNEGGNPKLSHLRFDAESNFNDGFEEEVFDDYAKGGNISYDVSDLING